MFALSKLAAPLIDPLTILLLTMAAGTALLYTRRFERWGRRVLTAACTTTLLLWIFPVGALWLAALEQRFPAPELPAQVDGIIVLGGDVDPGLVRRAGRFAAGSRGMPRLVAAAELARRYPEAQLVFSGGAGSLFAPEDRDADAARPLLEALGVPESRVFFEDRSRNTWENATETYARLRPRPGEVWLLVTSAFHVPRAVGCFRRAGWDVIAFPVDHLADPAEGPSLLRTPARRVGEFGRALKESVGLLAYWFLDRTEALLPAPR
jgi:uncharacterized SAM-binding protein YcdF (DUF218 family)